MTTYYNENDPNAAAWLRALIKQGLIADGQVDTRSIGDVRADDLTGFTQCHFFAGIGGWSYALRLAGWPDDRPVWTGSCPCQPFSDAGKGLGTSDERHLWPVFHRLIRECRPATIFGEQVASRAGLAWLDIVSSNLEDADYAIGAADLCAAGVGAPHIRQRLWFVGERLEHAARDGWEERWPQSSEWSVAGGCGDEQLGNSGSPRHEGHGLQSVHGEWQGRKPLRGIAGSGATGRLEHASSVGRERGQAPAPGHDDDGSAPGGAEGQHGAGLASSHRLHQDGARPTNGVWRDADWLHCRDGRWRPVEPNTFPLAHGIPARVGRLRGYGNAIVPQVAAAFIRAAS